MPKYYTMYITKQTIEERIRKYIGIAEPWSSDPMLDKRGAGVGDSIYWLNIRNGLLYVITAVRVGRILSYNDFSKQYGQDLADGWPHGKLFYIASQAAAFSLSREVTPEDAGGIRFESVNDRLKFSPANSDNLDPQTLRASRVLTPDSALILDSYIDHYVKVSSSEITALRKFL